MLKAPTRNLLVYWTSRRCYILKVLVETGAHTTTTEYAVLETPVHELTTTDQVNVTWLYMADKLPLRQTVFYLYLRNGIMVPSNHSDIVPFGSRVNFEKGEEVNIASNLCWNPLSRNLTVVPLPVEVGEPGEGVLLVI